jgi:hypothetical protein
MAAKCFSSPAISVGCALGVRWSGRSNALVVRGFTSSAPIEQQRCGGRRPERPQPHGESPPSVRRPCAIHTSTTTRACRDSHVPRFWSRTAILRHDPGLAASPQVRYTLGVEGSGYSPFPLIFRLGRATSSRSGGAAHGGAVGPGGSPTGRRMQPRDEKFFTLFSKAGSHVVESAAILMEFVAAPHERWAELARAMHDTRARRRRHH